MIATTTSKIQKLKDLMRSRNTEDQALTLCQIAFEIYPDIIENDLEYRPYSHLSAEETARLKTGHLRNLMREISKTDDEFRWLCVLPPVKTNKVNSSGRRIRPYIEYRYLNIKASKTPDLLSTRNEYWVKRRRAIVAGYEKRDKIEKDIAEWHEWKAKRKKFNPDDEK